jgi:hypothetical protein
MIEWHKIGDIDIDTSDRKALLQHVKHVPASMMRKQHFVPHNTGVYFHAVPTHPFAGTCSLPYEEAEQQACYKVDILNNHIYDDVSNEAHLHRLMETPVLWDLLQHEEVVRELAHINGHFEMVQALKPRSVLQLAMVLAMIRPGKRHLYRQCLSEGWHSLEPEIWDIDSNSHLYAFKKPHAVSYACLIAVQLNLLVEKLSLGCYNELTA